MKTLVKICGITNLKDAYTAADMGAHATGFVFYGESRRYISCEDARAIIHRLPAFLLKVGVFVNESWERIMEIKDYCRLDRVQIYADSPGISEKAIPELTIMAYRIRNEGDVEKARESAALPLFDTFHDKQYGGTGNRFDWKYLSGFDRPYILAGGIHAGNVKDALKLKPYAIDIASGVESSPGIKDCNKMMDIFHKVKAYNE